MDDRLRLNDLSRFYSEDEEGHTVLSSIELAVEAAYKLEDNPDEILENELHSIWIIAKELADEFGKISLPESAQYRQGRPARDSRDWKFYR